MRVEQSGFKASVQDKVRLLVATPTTLNVTLEIGTVSEQVTVEAAIAPTINTVDATRGNSLQAEEVRQLPFVARNPINLLTPQPGVVFTGQSDTDQLFQGSTNGLDQREGAVNGVRGNQTNVSVDGADANDLREYVARPTCLHRQT